MQSMFKGNSIAKSLILFISLVYTDYLYANQKPTVTPTSPSSGAQILSHQGIPAKANASDPDGTITHVQFRLNNGGWYTDSSPPYEKTFGAAGGDYTVSFRSMDNNGTYSDVVTRSVKVNHLPTINTSSPTSIKQNQNFVASASASDIDGSVVEMQFLMGSCCWRADTSAPFTMDFGTLSPGTHTVYYRAKDNRGQFSLGGVSSTVTVQANQKPTVTATSPSNGALVLSHQGIIARANASDSDGTISQVQFKLNNGGWYTDSSPPYEKTFGAAGGDYTVSFRSRDNSGAYSDVVTRSVKVNHLPTINTSSPTSVYDDQNFVASASASDVDGSVVEMQFLMGSCCWRADTSAPFTMNFGNLSPGTHTVHYRAKDNRGQFSLSGISTTVTVLSNQKPVVTPTSPSENQAYLYPARPVFSANASDSDGSVSSVEFFINGSWRTDSSAPYSMDYGLGSGAHTISYRAKDNKGKYSDVKTRDIYVNHRAEVSPTSPIEIYEDEDFIATADASDIDGNVTEVQFLMGPCCWRPDTSAPYSMNFGKLPIGTHMISYRVNDDKNNMSSGTDRYVTVLPRPNDPPVIDAIANQNIDEGATLTVTPTASDSDNDPLTFSIANKPEWADFDTATGELSGTTDFSDAGTYTDVTISVNDGKETRSSSFNIEVSDVVEISSIVSPVNAATVQPNNICFEWEEAQGAAKYTVQVSSDTNFDANSKRYVLADLPETSRSACFDDSFISNATAIASGERPNTHPGTYYWRMKTISDIETVKFSNHQQLIVEETPLLLNNLTNMVIEATLMQTQGASASETEGLTYTLNNAPPWMSIDNERGLIRVCPGIDDVGTYENIEVEVSKGSRSDSKTFEIKVNDYVESNPVTSPSDCTDCDALVAQVHQDSLTARQQSIDKFNDRAVPWPNGAHAIWGQNLQSLTRLFANDDIDKANTVLRTNLENASATSTPFQYFEAVDYIKILALFREDSPHTQFAGRLDPDVEEGMKEALWLWAKEFEDYWDYFRVQDEESFGSIWTIYATENHDLVRKGSNALIFAILAEDDDFKDRTTNSGMKVSEYHTNYTAYLKEWLRERAASGIWMEVGARYAKYSWSYILGWHDYHPDPEVRNLAKMLMDITFIDSAQLSFASGFQGGGHSRPDRGNPDTWIGINSGIKDLMFGETGGQSNHSKVYETSEYQVPDTAIFLREFGDQQAPFIVKNRVIAETAKKWQMKPDVYDVGFAYYLKPDSRFINYNYKTPTYSIGSTLQLLDGNSDEVNDDSAITRQDRWGGIFFNDKYHSRVVPFAEANREGSTRVHDAYWQVQHKNLMVAQKTYRAKYMNRMMVHLSGRLQHDKVESDGWVFTRHGDAYAAVKVVGGHEWKNATDYYCANHMFMIPNDQYAPIVFFAGSSHDGFDSYADFQSYVLDQLLIADQISTNEKIIISRPGEYPLTFNTNFTAPEIADPESPYNASTPLLTDEIYNSPYLKTGDNNYQIIAEWGDFKKLYDFQTGQVTDISESN